MQVSPLVVAALATAVVACSAATSQSGEPEVAAASKGKVTCDQSLADQLPPTTTSFIAPSRPVIPFYQWETNNGYCGETSLIQAGLASGQWTSQYNARLLCGAAGNGADAAAGTPLLQSGPAGFCAAHQQTPDYNAQLLLESAAAANAGTCLANYRLRYTLYDDPTSNVGLAGFQHYLSWVKAQVIAGKQVTIGVLSNGGDDPQYDHIVTVVKIGTNHSTTDATYHDDDVLYFDQHGSSTYRNGKDAKYPAVPPGAGSDAAGCTTYVFGYPFATLARTRAQANARSAGMYSILVPGVAFAATNTGGDGISEGPAVTAHNYAFAVGGPAAAESDGVLPVALAITSTSTGGQVNPRDPVAGYDYETPYLGTSDAQDGCLNTPPSAWMDMTFDVTVSGLTSGTSYNLYEYDVDTITGVGAAAALAVPTTRFNASAALATTATPFVATGTTYTITVTRRSSQTVVFRAVPASAP